jgi:hypothetical protein
MAIKGKGKTKARTVARAPRREPVAVPTPFLRRRWVQVVGGVLLGMAIVLFVAWIRAELRDNAEEDRRADELARRTAAIQVWRSELEEQIGTIGTLQDPLEPLVAQDIQDAVRQLDGDRKVTATADELRTSAEELAGVAGALNGFDLSGTLSDQGFTAGQVDQILSSRVEIVQALRQYRLAGITAALALEAEDQAVREDLAAMAKDLSDSANELLADGWRKFQLALSLAGIQPNVPSAPGFPGG